MSKRLSIDYLMVEYIQYPQIYQKFIIGLRKHFQIMKLLTGNLLIIMTTLCFITCSGVDTVNPHVSNSIEQSKANGVFINEYHAIQSFNKEIDSLVFNEVWMEKVWFNALDSSGFHHKVTKNRQLCFTIVQDSHSIFRRENVLGWLMKNEASDNYVGLFGNIYRIRIDDSEHIDTLNLVLFTVDDILKSKVGEVTFTTNQYR